MNLKKRLGVIYTNYESALHDIFYKVEDVLRAQCNLICEIEHMQEDKIIPLLQNLFNKTNEITGYVHSFLNAVFSNDYGTAKAAIENAIAVYNYILENYKSNVYPEYLNSFVFNYLGRVHKDLKFLQNLLNRVEAIGNGP